MFMLKVISLALLFLIQLRFPLDKFITHVLRSRYGNLVVKKSEPTLNSKFPRVMLTLRHSLHLKTFEKASVTNGYMVPENQGS